MRYMRYSCDTSIDTLDIAMIYMRYTHRKEGCSQHVPPLLLCQLLQEDQEEGVGRRGALQPLPGLRSTQTLAWQPQRVKLSIIHGIMLLMYRDISHISHMCISMYHSRISDMYQKVVYHGSDYVSRTYQDVSHTCIRVCIRVYITCIAYVSASF
jgi:hypothetical protein